MEILILSVLIVMAWHHYQHCKKSEKDQNLRIEITLRDEEETPAGKSFDEDFLEGLKIKNDEEA